MKKIFTFWEPRDQMPEYIKLCIETWKKYLPDYEVVILDYSNYEDWIGKDCYDSSLRTNFSLPKQADAIRAAVLNKHGGIWMDADTIVLSSEVKDLFATNTEFTIISRHIAVLSSIKNSMIANHWMKECQSRISKYKELKEKGASTKNLEVYYYLGNGPINDLLNQVDSSKAVTLDRSKIFAVPECNFYPKLDGISAYQRFYFKENNVKYLVDHCKIILLHNSWTPLEFKNMSKNDFLQTNCTLSNILRYALYKDKPLEFNKFLDSKLEINKLKKEVDSTKSLLNTKDIELKKLQNKSSELQLQLDAKTKENMQMLSKFKSLENTLDSMPIKKQSLEISNLEQDLINKKLKAQILEKELGYDYNAIQENKELKKKIKILQLIDKNINQQIINTAKSRIHNQLSYKLGKAMIENSKSIWGYIRMPYVLSYIKEQHKKEQIAYNEKIKTNPSLKLPPLESYPDYKEAIKEKECLTYKLGEAMIEADKSLLKLGYLSLWFKCKKIKREFKKR